MLKIKSAIQNSKLLKERYNIEGKYILFVWTLQPRKNIMRLVEAFSKVIHYYSSSERKRVEKSNKDEFSTSSNNKLQLVVVGKKGWMYEDILKAPKKFGVEKKVKFLDFVPDEDMEEFYKHALFFILPSLYEGFGLPVLEAMKYGCPVITSNVSSLPEAGGDAAIYVDPENVDDIASKMKLLMTNEKLRKEMIKKGYKQIKKFSWEKTARETLKTLEEVAKE
jgi:glycosyltransferase involved in cell wall biosynthesis